MSEQTQQMGASPDPPQGLAPSVVVLIPALRRPHNVQPVVDSLRASVAPDTFEVRPFFILDAHDDPEIEAVQASGADFVCHTGNYAEKINLGAVVTHEDLIFLGADDLHFHYGWLTEAMNMLSPDRFTAVIGTNDLCNPKVMQGIHATHFLVARWYMDKVGTIDEVGKLLHEGYEHEYVDNEFIDTAKRRGVYAHAGRSIVEHLHPMAGKAPMDELYADSERRMVTGREVYEGRMHLWQPESD